jgi:hypothetical protein
VQAAVRELEAAVKLQDGLPHMEPPYWYYPVRQTLGAVLLMQGEHERARWNTASSAPGSGTASGWILPGSESRYWRCPWCRGAQRPSTKYQFGPRRSQYGATQA